MTIMEDQAATETTFTGGGGFASAQVLDEARELLSSDSKIAVPTIVMVGFECESGPSDGDVESGLGLECFRLWLA